MNLDQLVSLFLCPACSSENACTRESETVTCGACGAVYPVHGLSIVIRTEEAALSKEWMQKQAEGEERYRADSYNADDTIPRLFGGFMAVTLRPDDVVLDVGCGLSEELPAYVRELRVGAYIGLEPLAAACDRKYPCLAGAVAERIPLRAASVDRVIFATSLDHVENLGPALSEVRRVLRASGTAYAWVGLYEPHVMAKALTYHDFLFSRGLVKHAAKVAFFPLYHARFLAKMAVRAYRLRRGIPLDEKHFRYYTRTRLGEELRSHGLALRRELLVPGSSSIFVECAIHD
jgi:SAM-dependent methyltransferase